MPCWFSIGAEQMTRLLLAWNNTCHLIGLLVQSPCALGLGSLLRVTQGGPQSFCRTMSLSGAQGPLPVSGGSEKNPGPCGCRSEGPMSLLATTQGSLSTSKVCPPVLTGQLGISSSLNLSNPLYGFTWSWGTPGKILFRKSPQNLLVMGFNYICKTSFVL